MVGDPNDPPNEQNITQVPTTTQFMVAAGAAAFDPNCNASSVAEALGNGCSAIGNFYGNLVPQGLWSNESCPTFGSYPSCDWVPASAELWSQLRGMMTTLIPPNSIRDSGDTMALLEQFNSTINQVPGTVPFGYMMDRFVGNVMSIFLNFVAYATFPP